MKLRQVLKHSVLGIVSFVTALTLSAPALATDASVGQLCFSGVSGRQFQGDVSTKGSIDWVRVKYQYPGPGTEPNARFVIFSKPVDDPRPTPSCDRQLALAKAQGISVLIAGRIEHLTLDGRIGRGLSNSLWIPSGEGKLDLTLGYVSTGLLPVGGGKLDLAKSRLYIESTREWLVQPSSVEGEVEIHGYFPRAITGVQLAFPGQAKATSDLRLKDPANDNLQIRLDIATGAATIWQGKYAMMPVTIDGDELDVGPMRFGKPKLSTHGASLTADHGKLITSVNDVSGSAANFSTTAGGLSAQGKQISLVATSLNGSTSQSTTAFAIESLAATNIKLSGADVGLSPKEGNSDIVEGPMSATFNTLSKDTLDGIVDWIKPKVSGLPLRFAQDSVQRINVQLKGTTNAPAVNGWLQAASFGWRGVGIASPVKLLFGRAPNAQELRLPIDLNVPAGGGSIELSDYDQKVLVTAKLQRLRLKAEVAIPITAPDAARLEIAPNQFDVAMQNSISTEPWLAGTKPTLANLNVELSNPVAVRISEDLSVGHFILSTDVLTLGQPILRIGKGGTERRANLDLDLDGKALFAMPIASPSLVLTKAILKAKAGFKFIDVAGSSIDIGGTIVTEPNVELKNLEIDIDALSKTNSIVAQGLSISGSRFERPRQSPSETAFSGRPEGAFQIEKIDAIPRLSSASMFIDEIDASGLRLSLTDAMLTLGETLVLDSAGISVSVDVVASKNERDKNDDGTAKCDENCRPVSVARQYFTNLEVHASGRLKESEFSPNMALDVPPTVSNLVLKVSGRSDRLDGAGKVRIGAFSGTYSTPYEFAFGCEDGSKPRTTLDGRFATGGTVGDLAISVDKGDFGVSGALAAVGYAFTSNKATGCPGSSKDIIVSEEKKISMTGWCPTWSNPGRTCEWYTIIPAIKFSYRLQFDFGAMAGGAAATSAYLKMDKSENLVCLVPPMQVTPQGIAMGITPQFVFNNTLPQIAKDIVNGTIRATLLSYESALLTAIGTSAAGIAGFVFNDPVLGTLACQILGKKH
ncbi:hypothetical protein [Caballeronia concitans]|uniref:AsmA family protein n=1 Tax=Caballeronia concitans TaxID=1777133 RepID=A0A658R557_9BURK|nr:hypothetical protein [Caballeronia concitans]SAL51438.1 hypothetical protein AWB72_05449 [Caballeronia concitans]